MCEYISDLSEGKKGANVELRYLNEFIHYKKLDEEYIYFRENAQEEIDENLPFSKFTLQ